MLMERGRGLDTLAVEAAAAERNAVRYRRSWPVQEKRRIVEESLAPGASVSIVARRHDLNTNQLFSWRRCYRRGDFDDGGMPEGPTEAADFIAIGLIDGPDESKSGPVTIVRSVPAASAPKKPQRPRKPKRVKERPGVIEVDLPTGARLRVDASVDEAALRRVLAAIKEVP
jgi:transposase